MPDPEVAPSQTAIVAVSRPGAALARRLASSIPDATLYLERRTGGNSSATNEGHRYYDLPLRPVIQDLFARYRELVVFLPVGAAVRLLAPVLGSKTQDPAVVCVDDAGRYAVSVLSGHRGGADALANRVAESIGAQAIVTSASDALDVTAIDLVGRDAGWRVEATSTDLTRAAAAVVNGDRWPCGSTPKRESTGQMGLHCRTALLSCPALSDAQDRRYAAALIVSDRLVCAANGSPSGHLPPADTGGGHRLPAWGIGRPPARIADAHPGRARPGGNEPRQTGHRRHQGRRGRHNRAGSLACGSA